MNKSIYTQKGSHGSYLEGKFERLLELAPDAVVVVDEAGRIRLVNARTEEMFAYRRDELIGQAMEVLVPELLRDRQVKDRDESAHEAGIRPVGSGYGLSGRKKDGSAFPVEISLSSLETESGRLITCIVRDVTQRREAEEKVKRRNLELEERVRSRTAELKQLRDSAEGYLDVAGVAIVVIDKDQKVTLINKKGCEILGYAQDEIIEKNWFDHFVPKTMRDEVKTVFNKIVSGEMVPPVYFQNPVLTKWNNERLMTWHNAVLKDAQGKITAILISGEDITEKTLLEQEVRQAEKLAVVGQLTSGFAHEIGTPLSVISGRAEYVLRKMSQDDPLRDNLERIIAQIERIAKIVRQLLSFTRPKPPEIKPVDLSRMLKETFLLFEHQFTEQEIRPTVHCPDRLPMTTADPDQMQQVFINLIMNAVQAMPKGGRLTLEVGRTVLRKDREDSVGDGYIKIAVTDTGSGISPENLKKIFHPFYSTKEPGKGTGLGLNISETIVNGHGGWIDVKSKVGQKTVFTVFLPIKPSEAGKTDG